MSAADENLSSVQFFPGYNVRNAAPEITGPAWRWGLGPYGGPRGAYGNYLSGNITQLSGQEPPPMGLELDGTGPGPSGTYATPGLGQGGESSN